MGLDVHNTVVDREGPTAHFSYTGFHDFRRGLAGAVGITLDQMRGFGGDTLWPNVKDEPLVYLLDHSDCEGSLDYDACAALADRLVPVAFRAFPGADDEHAYYRKTAEALAVMCQRVREGEAESVSFG